MSLAIAASKTAGSFHDGPAASSAAAHGTPNGLPFNAYLDAQTNVAAAAGEHQDGLASRKDAKPRRLSEDDAIDTRDSDVDSNDDDDPAEGQALLTVVAAPVAVDVQKASEDGAASQTNGGELLQHLQAEAAAGAFAQVPAENDNQVTEEGEGETAPTLAFDQNPPDQVTTESDAHRLRLVVGAKLLADAAFRARFLDDARARRLDFPPPSADSGAAQKELPATASFRAQQAAFGQLAQGLSIGPSGERVAIKTTPTEAPTSVASSEVASLLRDAAAAFAQEGEARQHAGTQSGDPSALLASRALETVQSGLNFNGAIEAVNAAAPGPVIPNDAGVTSSIVQSMRLQMRDGVGTAVVNLEPDYLGAVTIALRVEGGTVTATLHAQNPQVRAWMEANEAVLRQGLSEQGLTLDRLIVSDERLSEEQSRSDGRRQSHDHEQPRPRPRRNETSTFEVVV